MVGQAERLELQSEGALPCKQLGSVGSIKTIDAVRPQHAALLHAQRNWHSTGTRVRPTICSSMENAHLIHNLTCEFQQTVYTRVVVRVDFAFGGKIVVNVPDEYDTKKSFGKAEDVPDGMLWVTDASIEHLYSSLEPSQVLQENTK